MKPGDKNTDTVLYKYREFGNPKHETVLENNELYLSSPSRFQDPKDCAIQVVLGSSVPESFVQDLKQRLRESHSEASDQQIGIALLEYIKDDEPTDGEVFRDMAGKTFGVCSLARNPNSSEMWRQYAGNHTGFCVGLRWKKLQEWLASQGSDIFAAPVSYPERRPVLNVSEADLGDILLTGLTTKQRSYEWEEEYRIIGHKVVNEPIELPDEVFHSVAVGINASDVNRQKAIRFASSMHTPVRVLRGSNVAGNKVVFDLVREF